MKLIRTLIVLFSIVILLVTNSVIAENSKKVLKGAELKPSKVSTKQYSYRDRGRTYKTLSKQASLNYHKIGIASYYGGKFNGRKTANGEIFSENNFTAAHKTLAFGTYLLVTNLKNNRKIIVRVNDRGPFSKSRILDVSKIAARSLGMLHSGVTKVKVEALHVDSKGYISGKGTQTLVQLAKKSGISLKIKSSSKKYIQKKKSNKKTNKSKESKKTKLNSSFGIKVVALKSKNEAKKLTMLVKPKAIIKKNGKTYDVYIPAKNIVEAQHFKRKLSGFTHNRVYIYNNK